MKAFFINIAANMASILCAIAAFVLAHGDKAGWGWFLVVAVLLATTGTVKTKEQPK